MANQRVAICLFLTLLASTGKLLTRAGFELAPSETPVMQPLYQLSYRVTAWERCAYLIQFKCTRYSRNDLRPCHTRQFSLQLATQWRCIALQVARKTSSCVQRKIALQVAEKVEAASTFRNATRQVAACNTPHCNLSRNFLRRNQSQYDIIRMPLTFLNT